jgi:hypothetical protein
VREKENTRLCGDLVKSITSRCKNGDMNERKNESENKVNDAKNERRRNLGAKKEGIDVSREGRSERRWTKVILIMM